MRVLLPFVLLICGCSSRIKVDNPVVGPPPPRKSNVRPEALTAEDGTGSEILQADGAEFASLDRTEGLSPAGEVSAVSMIDEDLEQSQVVATVNGKPIFAEELLGAHGRDLAAARQQLSPDRYQQFRNGLIKRNLTPTIQNRLLVEAMMESLKEEQREQLDGHLDQMFATEMQRLQREMKVNSPLELEISLQEKGTSLEYVRYVFLNQMMAREYLGAKAQPTNPIGRPEILEYYNQHKEEYAFPTRVKWKQIVVSFAKHGGRDNALRVMNDAVQELKNDRRFADVAKKYSDGPTAQNGGEWDWTQPSSLANANVSQELADLPIGRISSPIVDDTSVQLVLVVDRQEAGYAPLAEKQAEIKQILEQEERGRKAQELIEKLVENAVIETVFDEA